MASTSIMRNGLTSPVYAAMKTGSSKSILKRPAALPLSPRSTASFSIVVSPRVKSPHVHFPPSPAIAATYATHAKSLYDRTSIAVSPNPLVLPSWGDRIYSPSIDGFKRGGTPRPFRSLTYQSSPVITDFEDPRSPKAQPAAKTGGVRFAPFPVTPIARPSKALDNSVLTYPRSPYPSAPLVQEESDLESDAVGLEQKYGHDWPEDRKSAQVAAVSRARSLAEKGRNKKGLSLASRRTAQGFLSLSSPLTQSFAVGSPVLESSLKRSNKPKPLDLNALEADKLSEDFWKSVSVQEPDSADDAPMVTAREYPESATMYEANQEAEMASATAPALVFAGADGVPLWSPGLPKPGHAAAKIRESLMSPSVKRTSFSGIARKEVTAPSPNDPFAAFPSFAAVLDNGRMDGAIQYPAPVVSRG